MTYNRLPRAVLFDMDDTLIDYTGGIDNCWHEACLLHAANCGVNPEQLYGAIDKFRRWYWGDPVRHAAKRMDMKGARREIVVGALETLGCIDNRAAHALADSFTQSREEYHRLFPDTIATLEHAKRQGVLMALITNGHPSSQRPKIEKFGLAPFFDCIVIEGEFGIGKPDSRVYEHALQALGVLPNETWMVGDNLEWEVAAPQKLGIAGIWMDSAGNGLPKGSTVRPDRIIRRLWELWE